MKKITREELERTKRVERYKKIIVYGFLTLTIFPIFMSLFLLYRLGRLEKQVDMAMSGTMKTSVKTVLGNASVDTDSISGKNGIKQTGGEAEDADNVEEVKRVYLTFDDGPSIYTGQILDILNENNVKATFFVIGKEEEYYDYYKRIVQEGHTIGMHSYTHVYEDLYASVDSFANEITELNTLIYDTTGVKSTIFRFPGGSSNTVAPLPIENYIKYLNQNGIRYYDWNALNGDAVTSDLSPEQLVDNIMNDVRKHTDSIVLMHDLRTTHTTVESLQLLIDTLKKEGYEILPIDDETPLIQHVSYDSVQE